MFDGILATDFSSILTDVSSLIPLVLPVMIGLLAIYAGIKLIRKMVK